MDKNKKFCELLIPSEKKKQQCKNLRLKLQLQWLFKEECEDTFDFDFINQSLSNILLKFYGLIGSAQYKIIIDDFSSESKTSDIIITHRHLNGFWAAISQANNCLGTDGLIDFKIQILDIDFIKENINGKDIE